MNVRERAAHGVLGLDTVPARILEAERHWAHGPRGGLSATALPTLVRGMRMGECGRADLQPKDRRGSGWGGLPLGEWERSHDRVIRVKIDKARLCVATFRAAALPTLVRGMRMRVSVGEPICSMEIAAAPAGSGCHSANVGAQPR